MNRFLFYMLGFVSIISCNSDDIQNAECGGIIDFIGPRSLLVELVDENDNNLISASINGNVFDSEELMPEFIEQENTLFLQTIFGNGENNQWVISLSETDKDTLNYYLEITEVRDESEGVVFCGTSVTLESADYNGTSISLEDSNTQINSSNAILVKVVKTE